MYSDKLNKSIKLNINIYIKIYCKIAIMFNAKSNCKPPVTIVTITNF